MAEANVEMILTMMGDAFVVKIKSVLGVCMYDLGEKKRRRGWEVVLVMMKEKKKEKQKKPKASYITTGCGASWWYL